jgi:hypothetical protein
MNHQTVVSLNRHKNLVFTTSQSYVMAGLTMRFGDLERSMNNKWNDEGRDGFVPHEADPRQQDDESLQQPWHPGRSGELSTSPLDPRHSRNPSYDSPRVADMAMYDQPLESPIANRAGVDDTTADLGHPGRPHNQDTSMGFDNRTLQQLYAASVLEDMMPIMEQSDPIHYSPVTSFSEYPSYDETGVSGHEDLTTIRGPHPGVSQPIIFHFFDHRFDNRCLHSNQYPMYRYQDHEPVEDRKPPPVDRTVREMQNPEESNEEEISNLKSPPVASLPVAPSRRVSAPRKRPPTRASTKRKSMRKAPPVGPSFKTVTGERTSERRVELSKEELDEAPNSRAKKALFTWYKRIHDLDVYRTEHGHCKWK